MDTQPMIPNSNKSLIHPHKVLSWLVVLISILLLAGSVCLYYIRMSYLEAGEKITQETNQRVEQMKQQREQAPIGEGMSCGGGPLPGGGDGCPSGYICSISSKEVDARGTCIRDSETEAPWKTYTNTEYGFEFKYPGDWSFKQDKSNNADGFFITKDSSTISILPRGEFDYGLEGEVMTSEKQLAGKTVMVSIYCLLYHRYKKIPDESGIGKLRNKELFLAT